VGLDGLGKKTMEMFEGNGEMSNVPNEYEGTWEELAALAPDLAGRRLRLIVLDARESTGAGPGESLEDRLSDLASKVPPEDWSQLPVDLTDRLDDHIYGHAGQ
jgi:hypothetical protein